MKIQQQISVILFVLQLKLHIRCTRLVFSNFTNFSKLSLHISKNMSKRKAETENPNAEFCDFLMGKLTNVTGFYGIFFFYFFASKSQTEIEIEHLKTQERKKAS